MLNKISARSSESIFVFSFSGLLRLHVLLVPKSYAPIYALSGKRLSSGARSLSRGGAAMADTVEAEGQARRTVHACTKARWPTGEPSTPLIRGTVPAPDLRAKLGSVRVAGHPCFAEIRGDAAVRLDYPDNCVQCHPCSRGRCDDIQIIQQRQQLVCRVKGARCLHQGIVLPQGKKRRGQRVALFATLGLWISRRRPLASHQL